MDREVFCDVYCPMPFRSKYRDSEDLIDCDTEGSECPFYDVDFSKVHRYGEIEGASSIGLRRCWVCNNDLALTQIPSGCEIGCLNSLVEHGTMASSDGEKAWMCPTHLTLWYDRQRMSCLEEKEEEITTREVRERIKKASS